VPLKVYLAGLQQLGNTKRNS